MAADIRRIHHVGHLVTDMAATLERYRRMGFEFAAPAYPMVSPADGEPPRFLGATNTHLSFPDNFVELATVVPDGASPPADAKLVHLQIAPDALPRALETARRTVATLTASLARFQGLHILVFESGSITASALRLDQEGVRHSGTNLVQRKLDALDGESVVPVHFLELDGERIIEGRLAIAENPTAEILKRQRHLKHPNGAFELIECVLCVADTELEAFAVRYSRYIGRQARSDGSLRIFDLGTNRVVIAPAAALDGLFPGERACQLPAFVAYTVAVHDLASTEGLLGANGVPHSRRNASEVFVPSTWALGAAVAFRQG